ncbi:hypothetical protein L4C38_20550 [Vibrio kasasachensis]|uniref:hypothetical protein n=1 Tax=Vibrio kasasachensis TaxID=2910248 RepID=UPI003D12CF21
MSKRLIWVMALFLSGCSPSSSNIKQDQPNTGIVEINQGNRIEINHTPDGNLILYAKNKTTLASKGELTVLLGSDIISKWNIPALVGINSLYGINPKGENLTIVNTSIFKDTPIDFNIFSPGLNENVLLHPNGISQPLELKKVYKALIYPRRMQLKVNSPGDFAVILIYQGGVPSIYLLNAENNVNYPEIENIEIFSKTGNSLTIEKIFHSEYLLIVNLSPKQTKDVSISLTLL